MTPRVAERDAASPSEPQSPVAPCVVELSPYSTTLDGEWNALADSAAAHPFSHPGWVMAWSRTLGAGDLRLLVARREGHLVGLLALVAGRGGLRSAANEHTHAIPCVVRDLAAARELGKGLLALSKRRIDITPIAESLELAGIRTAAGAARRRLASRTVHESPFVAFDELDGDPSHRLSRNRRRGLDRQRRRLEHADRLCLDVNACAGPRLDALLEEGFAIEGSGWKQRRGTAIISSTATRDFYTEVARWSDARGSLRLSFLRLSGRALAFDYSICHGSNWYSIKSGYDPEFRAYGPGILLLYQLLQHARCEGALRFELLGADEPYKREWMTGTRAQHSISLFGPSLLGVAGWTSFAVGRRVRRRLKAWRDTG